MAQQRHREEVINVYLAQLFSELGESADAETIMLQGKHRPDVLLNFRGLSLHIESKCNDAANAKTAAFEDACKRIDAGVANIAVAVVYPEELRTTAQKKLSDALKKATLEYQIVSETFEEGDWDEGTPIQMLETLRRIQGKLMSREVVEKTAKGLHDLLNRIAGLWISQTGVCDRLSKQLGMEKPEDESEDDAKGRRETVIKISALVIANAFIFQEQLSSPDQRVNTLNKQEDNENLIGATIEHWNWIRKNINYASIFQLGEKILKEIPESNTEDIRLLIKEVQKICRSKVALRHDLMGRIYHWLLHDKKYLGTYYTSVPAATLLLKLTFAVDWKQDFGNLEEIAEFKVADFSCGTGTLLMAATREFEDKYRLARWKTNRSLNPNDFSDLHQTLLEDVLYGYDILPTAVHLTASTLALLAPNITFKSMNLYVVSQSIDHNKKQLGSLDFLESDSIITQLSFNEEQKEVYRVSADESYAAPATAPKLDLCVMNPPFVRSVGSNLLFGSVPEKDRTTLRNELKRRIKKISANATAGLGSVFIALGDKYLKEGGRFAIVLPGALATGEAWKETRQLIAEKYHLEMVITSHDAKLSNFSENTGLSEILFIARKRRKDEKIGGGGGGALRTTYINLWHNPASMHEAMQFASKINGAKGDVTEVEGNGLTSIKVGDKKIAEMFSTPVPIDTENWQGSMISQVKLFRICQNLQNGILSLPETGSSNNNFSLPLTELSKLGGLGYDRRDMHDAFMPPKKTEKLNGDWSPYSGFWNHDSKKVTSISQKPNTRLIERTKPDKNRKIKNPSEVWKKAGRILLSQRLSFNTHKLIAIGLPEPVVANTWWTMDTTKLSEEQIKSLLLFLNSTFGIALYFARRIPTKGVFISQKKPAWESMPVLNVLDLQKHQINKLAKAYDKLAEKPLKSIFQLEKDEARISIDDVLCNTLKLPNIKQLRELLSREAGIRGTKTG